MDFNLNTMENMESRLNNFNKLYVSKFDELKQIKSDIFKLKEHYNSIIPLDIYMSWGSKQLPPKMQANVDEMKTLNPEFTVNVYDDEMCREFIMNHFPQDVVDAFDNLIPGAYKSDLWRYCVMYIKGGIYLDIKFKCINGFRLIALTESEHYVLDTTLSWNEKQFIGLYNAIIVSLPGNQLMLNCIHKIVENVKNKYYGHTDLYPTGPILMGREYLNLYNEKSNIIDIVNDYNIQEDKYYLNIIYNNIIIIKDYNEYRSEQLNNSNLPHYSRLYKERRIYL